MITNAGAWAAARWTADGSISIIWRLTALRLAGFCRRTTATRPSPSTTTVPDIGPGYPAGPVTVPESVSADR